jgi:hypothetical protein
MKTNSLRFNQLITAPLVAKLIFPALLVLISFKPAEATAKPKLPVIRKELKIESAFQNIRIEGYISVILTNDPVGTVIIEGKEKELNKIEPVIKNNTLIMDAYGKNPFAKLTLYLSAKTLKTIQFNGNGNISSIDFIQSDRLNISLNGNIKVKVKTMGQINFDTADEIDLLWKTPLMKKNYESQAFVNGE